MPTLVRPSCAIMLTRTLRRPLAPIGRDSDPLFLFPLFPGPIADARERRRNIWRNRRARRGVDSVHEEVFPCASGLYCLPCSC
jgi:hypothetical protein